jgi:hypothetical protein
VYKSAAPLGAASPFKLLRLACWNRLGAETLADEARIFEVTEQECAPERTRSKNTTIITLMMTGKPPLHRTQTVS